VVEGYEGTGYNRPKISRSQFYLTEQDVRLLIMNAENLRDKIIIKLLAYCGLRRFEVAKITVEDIDIKTKKIQIIGKGDILRLATIFSEQLVEDLKMYIQFHLQGIKKGWMFPSNYTKSKSGHLNIAEINKIVGRAGRLAMLTNPNPTLKNINPHILRHSCARILKDRGLSLEVIQKVLGHTSFKMTMDLYGTKSIYEMDKELEDKAGDMFD
jgi:integrase